MAERQQASQRAAESASQRGLNERAPTEGLAHEAGLGLHGPGAASPPRLNRPNLVYLQRYAGNGSVARLLQRRTATPDRQDEAQAQPEGAALTAAPSTVQRQAASQTVQRQAHAPAAPARTATPATPARPAGPAPRQSEEAGPERVDQTGIAEVSPPASSGTGPPAGPSLEALFAEPFRSPEQAYQAGYQYAVQRMVQRAPLANPPAPTDPASAVVDLGKYLNQSFNLEAVYGIAMRMAGKYDAVEAAWKEKPPQGAAETLDMNIRMRMTPPQLVRVKAYFRDGTLHTADKIFIACFGAGTDEDTLYRLMPEAKATLAKVEEDIRTSYKEEWGDKSGKLPNQQTSLLAGVLDSELSDWELDKAKALLAFGQLRPVDEIRVAVNRAGTEEAMLFGALGQVKDVEKLKTDYQSSYEEELYKRLESELSGEDWKRAKATLEGSLTPKRQIEIACEGLGTNEEMIWQALQKATPEQRAEMLTEFNNQSSAFYQALADDLDEADMARVKAMLGSSAKSSAIEKLEQAGATDGDKIERHFKAAATEQLAFYWKAYSEGEEGFHYFQDYVDPRLTDANLVKTLLSGTPTQRIRVAIGGTFSDDEDYVYHVLDSIQANDTAKKAILNDASLMKDLESALTTAEMAKVRSLLLTSDMSLQQRADALDKQIKGEKSSFVDFFSSAEDPLNDEQRELKFGLGQVPADGKMTPEQQEALGKKLASTQEALGVYVKARDEIQAVATTIVTTAVGILVTVLTAGAGAAAIATMTLQQIARQVAIAALAQAVTRVAVTKAVKGDQFEVLGSDGAIAFGIGVIDGVTSVLGAPAVQSIVNPAFRTASGVAAKTAAEKAFNGVLGNRVLSGAMEGGASGGLSSLFESTASDDTWKGGFEMAASNIGGATGKGILSGAVISAGVGGVTGAIHGVDAPGGSVRWAQLDAAVVSRLEARGITQTIFDGLVTAGYPSGTLQHALSNFQGVLGQPGHGEVDNFVALLNSHAGTKPAALTSALEQLQAGGSPSASDFLSRVSNMRSEPSLGNVDIDALKARYDAGDCLLTQGHLQAGVQPSKPHEITGGYILQTPSGGRPAKQLTNEWANKVDFVIVGQGSGAELRFGREHSGLSGNATSVYAAGQLYFDGQGRITAIINDSGHYRPTVANRDRAYGWLVSHGHLDPNLPVQRLAVGP